MVNAHNVWPCGAFLAEGHLNRRNFSAMLRQISLVPARASWCSETTRLGAILRQRFHRWCRVTAGLQVAQPGSSILDTTVLPTTRLKIDF